MLRIGKGRRTLMLLLPLLLGFAFQATQYARAPAEYNYYLVYAKNADIALKPGNDLSPNGATLLQNTTTQEGYYNLILGRWSPGYRINYTDAFGICNREVFDIRMIGFNFTSASAGTENIYIWVQNDTDADGIWNQTAGDTWVTVFDGTEQLSPSNYIYIKAASSYGDDGGLAKVWIEVLIATSGHAINNTTPEIEYTGNIYLWFTSASF